MDDASDGSRRTVNPDGLKPVIIFRPYITTKDSRKVWARTFGKRAFPIVVGPDTEATIRPLRASRRGRATAPFVFERWQTQRRAVTFLGV